MLPEKRKKLIFTIVAIIGVILVIIIMYNLAKYMRNQGVETPEERDDAYPEVYPYYGVYYDTEGTYKLKGLNGSFEETEEIKEKYELPEYEDDESFRRAVEDVINRANREDKSEKGEEI